MLESLFKKPTPNTKQKGKFIAIDGTAGAGISMQAELLQKTLRISGYGNLTETESNTIVSFPQHNTASKYVLENYSGTATPEAAAIFYALDRLDASASIREKLLQGEIVVADRYVVSNAAYQGARIEDKSSRIKFYSWLDTLEYTTFAIPRPDLTIILHAPFGVLTELENERLKKNTESGANKLKKEESQILERTYLEVSELYPNTKLVKCYRDGKLITPEEIHARVWELVRRIVLRDIKPQPLQ